MPRWLCVVGKILWSLWKEREEEKEEEEKIDQKLKEKNQLKCRRKLTIEIVCNLWHSQYCSFSSFSSFCNWIAIDDFDLTENARTLRPFVGMPCSELEWKNLFICANNNRIVCLLLFAMFWDNSKAPIFINEIKKEKKIFCNSGRILSVQTQSIFQLLSNSFCSKNGQTEVHKKTIEWLFSLLSPNLPQQATHAYFHYSSLRLLWFPFVRSTIPKQTPGWESSRGVLTLLMR